MYFSTLEEIRYYAESAEAYDNRNSLLRPYNESIFSKKKKNKNVKNNIIKFPTFKEQ